MFEKAFDTVWRDGLWYKLLMCNIKGKMYNVILNTYNNIKSRILYNDSVSNFYPCDKEKEKRTLKMIYKLM